MICKRIYNSESLMVGFLKKNIRYYVISLGMGCEGQGKSVEMRCAVSVPTLKPSSQITSMDLSSPVITNEKNAFVFSPGLALLHSQLPKPGFPREELGAV